MSVTINGSTGITTPNISAADSSSKIPGEIFKFAGSVAPAGCLACPTIQTLVSTATYPNLFAAIGYTWGGAGASFGLPYFPTGYSAVQGTVGVVTHGAVMAHSHAISPNALYGYISGSGSSNAAPFGLSPQYVGNTQTTGGSDNLPAGMGVMYCVKY